MDALALHDYLGPALNPIFSDPNIVKVLHGCANDVVWLQRDFHLYLVNVFDTEKAAQVRTGVTQVSLSCHPGVTQVSQAGGKGNRRA